MTAILAIAALHHSRIASDGDLYEAMGYHDRCLHMMVPMLSDPDRLNDDCVLVTTVILHLYEDLDCKCPILFPYLQSMLTHATQSWQ